jgi:four helix bundle protein
MHTFRKLKVYVRAIAFTKNICRIIKEYPPDELYGLTSQLRRAATSIALNIAEGAGSSGNREFSKFLSYSIRSAYECVACYDIARSVEILSAEEAESQVAEAQEIVSMLVGLQRALRTS